MKYILLFFLVLLIFADCSHKTQLEYRPEFKIYFDEYNVEGSFLLFDFQKNTTLIYNKEKSHEEFLPASTFKILNTLIGLETGIVTGEDFVIPWDSVPRQIPVWNRDHNLASAFQNSVVPWYQELARRIGLEKMQLWVAKSNYGKMDVNNENIDLFWLTGKSRISPQEQLEFQKRLVKNKLPFSQSNIDLVKKIMILEETPNYIFRGKTGWAVMNEKNIGWLVGYLERDSKIYAYAICVESGDENISEFPKSRIEISHKIFKQLSLM
jgi:beta-lactamase class D